jgi:RecJ-like exonuclease
MISIIGIFSLFIICDNIDLALKDIDKIEETDQMIKIRGEVINIKEYETTALLKVSQPSDLEVLLFKKGNISIKEGSYVEIEGEVKETEDGLQLIGHEIRE